MAMALCGLVVLAWRILQHAGTAHELISGIAEVRAALRPRPAQVHPGIELGDVVAFADAIAPVATRVTGLQLAVEGEGV